MGRMNMRKVVFWGAGKIGRDVLEFWRSHWIHPDFFCDNRQELWGRDIDGIGILSPEQVYKLENPTVYITCIYFDEILGQLLEKGISRDNIVKADHICEREMLCKISDYLKSYFMEETHVCQSDRSLIQETRVCQSKRGLMQETNDGLKKGCLIDLSMGMVLGGVEKWSYTLADVLKNCGFEGAYLMPDSSHNGMENHTFPAICVDLNKRPNKKSVLDLYIEGIVYSRYENIVCNFPFEIFVAACMVKKMSLRELRIIAVVHCDEEVYYQTFCSWSDYIDKCLVISEKMKRTLVKRGFPLEKIEVLYWKIPCDKELVREYSSANEPIHIGYAGRLTKRQKRLDLVVDVAEKLKSNGIDFLLELAGTGDYEKELQAEILHRNLSDCMILKGMINRNEIPEFWKKQDIYLSCSDWEGHSISQSEAMAEGVVPVVTNTSGTEEDIKSGYNGYIAELQDIDSMTKNIVHLYQNRELLPIMGKRSYEIILERSEKLNEEAFWKKMLRE